jgi:ubiquinone/menaquinone biosynthesis C-methylase UbiE
VFRLLAQAPQDAQAIALALGADLRGTRLLLNACVGLGLLQADATGFRLTDLSGAYLVPDRPGYLGDALGYNDDLYAAWGRLGESVKSGQPVVPAASYTGNDPERTRHFVYGMHNRALGVGRALVTLVDLSACRQLLDVGGGPGTYAALFAQRHPSLTATVLDLPAVAEIGAEIVADMGVAERVRHLPGDYTEADFPDGQDVVLISGVFHRETEASCQALIARARRALAPGGQLIISDVFTDAGGTATPFATLFGLNMLLTADDGGVHADADVAEWLAEAGFDEVTRRAFPPPLPHRVVSGIKP